MILQWSLGNTYRNDNIENKRNSLGKVAMYVRSYVEKADSKEKYRCCDKINMSSSNFSNSPEVYSQ